MVERVHRIIKHGLLCFKEDLGNKYNVNFALDQVVENKNNTICRVTKKTPNELFHMENIDEKEIQRINNLMLESQKNSNIFKNSYKIGEKILINNNIKLVGNTIKKNNKKIGIWNITAKIIKIYSGGSYKIKIISDENDFFEKNNEYYIYNINKKNK